MIRNQVHQQLLVDFSIVKMGFKSNHLRFSKLMNLNPIFPCLADHLATLEVCQMNLLFSYPSAASFSSDRSTHSTSTSVSS